MRRVFRGLYYQNQKNTPTRLRLFDYLDHHSNAHMGWHIITNDINKTIFQATKYWLLPPQTEPFSKKTQIFQSSQSRVTELSGRRRKVFQPFKRLKRNEKNWLGHRCQRMQRCCRDLSFNSCWVFAPEKWASKSNLVGLK